MYQQKSFISKLHSLLVAKKSLNKNTHAQLYSSPPTRALKKITTATAMRSFRKPRRSLREVTVGLRAAWKVAFSSVSTLFRNPRANPFRLGSKRHWAAKKSLGRMRPLPFLTRFRHAQTSALPWKARARFGFRTHASALLGQNGFAGRALLGRHAQNLALVFLGGRAFTQNLRRSSSLLFPTSKSLGLPSDIFSTRSSGKYTSWINLAESNVAWESAHLPADEKAFLSDETLTNYAGTPHDVPFWLFDEEESLQINRHMPEKNALRRSSRTLARAKTLKSSVRLRRLRRLRRSLRCFTKGLCHNSTTRKNRSTRAYNPEYKSLWLCLARIQDYCGAGFFSLTDTISKRWIGRKFGHKAKTTEVNLYANIDAYDVYASRLKKSVRKFRRKYIENPETGAVPPGEPSTKELRVYFADCRELQDIQDEEKNLENGENMMPDYFSQDDPDEAFNEAQDAWSIFLKKAKLGRVYERKNLSDLRRISANFVFASSAPVQDTDLVWAPLIATIRANFRDFAAFYWRLAQRFCRRAHLTPRAHVYLNGLGHHYTLQALHLAVSCLEPSLEITNLVFDYEAILATRAALNKPQSLRYAYRAWLGDSTHLLNSLAAIQSKVSTAAVNNLFSAQYNLDRSWRPFSPRARVRSQVRSWDSARPALAKKTLNVFRALAKKRFYGFYKKIRRTRRKGFKAQVIRLLGQTQAPSPQKQPRSHFRHLRQGQTPFRSRGISRRLRRPLFLFWRKKTYPKHMLKTIKYLRPRRYIYRRFLKTRLRIYGALKNRFIARVRKTSLVVFNTKLSSSPEGSFHAPTSTRGLVSFGRRASRRWLRQIRYRKKKPRRLLRFYAEEQRRLRRGQASLNLVCPKSLRFFSNRKLFKKKPRRFLFAPWPGRSKKKKDTERRKNLVCPPKPTFVYRKFFSAPPAILGSAFAHRRGLNRGRTQRTPIYPIRMYRLHKNRDENARPLVRRDLPSTKKERAEVFNRGPLAKHRAAVHSVRTWHGYSHAAAHRRKFFSEPQVDLDLAQSGRPRVFGYDHARNAYQVAYTTKWSARPALIPHTDWYGAYGRHLSIYQLMKTRGLKYAQDNHALKFIGPSLIFKKEPSLSLDAAISELANTNENLRAPLAKSFKIHSEIVSAPGTKPFQSAETYDLGLFTRRLPGIGNMKQSYPALVKTGYLRLAPARLRRRSVYSFRHVRPVYTENFALTRLKYETSPGQRLQARMGARLARHTYVTRYWRKALSLFQKKHGIRRTQPQLARESVLVHGGRLSRLQTGRGGRKARFNPYTGYLSETDLVRTESKPRFRFLSGSLEENIRGALTARFQTKEYKELKARLEKKVDVKDSKSVIYHSESRRGFRRKRRRPARYSPTGRSYARASETFWAIRFLNEGLRMRRRRPLRRMHYMPSGESFPAKKQNRDQARIDWDRFVRKTIKKKRKRAKTGFELTAEARSFLYPDVKRRVCFSRMNTRWLQTMRFPAFLGGFIGSKPACAPGHFTWNFFVRTIVPRNTRIRNYYLRKNRRLKSGRNRFAITWKTKISSTAAFHYPRRRHWRRFRPRKGFLGRRDQGFEVSKKIKDRASGTYDGLEKNTKARNRVLGSGQGKTITRLRDRMIEAFEIRPRWWKPALFGSYKRFIQGTFSNQTAKRLRFVKASKFPTRRPPAPKKLVFVTKTRTFGKFKSWLNQFSAQRRLHRERKWVPCARLVSGQTGTNLAHKTIISTIKSKGPETFSKTNPPHKQSKPYSTGTLKMRLGLGVNLRRALKTRLCIVRKIFNVRAQTFQSESIPSFKRPVVYYNWAQASQHAKFRRDDVAASDRTFRKRDKRKRWTYWKFLPARVYGFARRDQIVKNPEAAWIFRIKGAQTFSGSLSTKAGFNIARKEVAERFAEDMPKNKFRSRAKLSRRSSRALSRGRNHVRARLIKKISTLNAIRRQTQIELSFTSRARDRAPLTSILQILPLVFFRGEVGLEAKALQAAQIQAKKTETHETAYALGLAAAKALTETWPQILALFTRNLFGLVSHKVAIVKSAALSGYWSLRLLLVQPRTPQKIYKQKQLVTFYKKVKSFLEKTSIAEGFTERKLEEARSRFSPLALLKRPQLRVGSKRWLRVFMPKHYSLYLENPAKYKRFLPAAINIFSSDLSNDFVGSWETQPAAATPDERYRILLGDGVGTRRFENILFTARRGLAFTEPVEKTRAKLIVQSKRQSFFARAISTFAQGRIQPRVSSLFMERMRHEVRHVSDPDTGTSQARGVRTHQVAKQRAVRAGATSKIPGLGQAPSGAINETYTRNKSGRQGTYVQEKPEWGPKTRVDLRVCKNKKKPISRCDFLVAKIREQKRAFNKASNREAQIRFQAQSLVSMRATAIDLEAHDKTEVNLTKRARGARNFLVALSSVETKTKAIFWRKAKARSSRGVNSRKPRLIPNHVDVKEGKTDIKITVPEITPETRTFGRQWLDWFLGGKKGKKPITHTAAEFFNPEDAEVTTKPKKTRSRPLYSSPSEASRAFARKVIISKPRHLRRRTKLPWLVANPFSSGKAHNLGRIEIKYKKRRYAKNVQILTKTIRGTKTEGKKRARRRRQLPTWKNRKYLGLEKNDITGTDVPGQLKDLKSYGEALLADRKVKVSLGPTTRKPMERLTPAVQLVHGGLPDRRKIISTRKIRPTSAQIIDEENLSDLRMRRMLKQLRPKGFLKKITRIWNDVTRRWNKKYRIMPHWLRDMNRSLKAQEWGPMGPETWKRVRSRLRRLIWNESSDRFDNKGTRKPKRFQFHFRERKQMPWLEALIYPRTLYRTQRGPVLRDQAPGDQKNKQWLQSFRKTFAPMYKSKRYIRNRRWPHLRIANYRLHLPLFGFRTIKAAQRHYRKISRHKVLEHVDERFMAGTGNRLDVTLILLGLAHTVYWARNLAILGLIRINGRVITDCDHLLKPGDVLHLNTKRVEAARQTFVPAQKRIYVLRKKRLLTTTASKNIKYYHKTQTYVYTRFPRANDISKSSRINSTLHTLFRLDAGKNRQFHSSTVFGLFRKTYDNKEIKTFPGLEGYVVAFISKSGDTNSVDQRNSTNLLAPQGRDEILKLLN